VKITAIVLAAGKGKRFGASGVNKTAIKINGKSLVQIGLEKVEPLVDGLIVVVGHKKQSVIDSIKTKNVKFVTQKKRLGTGHAFKLALNEIKRQKTKPDHIFVANGDHLFQVSKNIINNLIDEHAKKGNDATILTSIHPNPEKRDNGRIVRKKGKIVRIIEKHEYTKSARKIKELNSGNYIFKYSTIKPVLDATKVGRVKEMNLVYSIFKLKKIGGYKTLYKNVGPGVNTKSDLERYLEKKKLDDCNY
jgi:bifunctional UDP-N-acetylglucosamine pyrophosphorylase/glucosamine-1-phosphate N-acetyltransferase